jgi:NhaP-type Na+/H+ or K+/H+ antiporter
MAEEDFQHAEEFSDYGIGPFLVILAFGVLSARLLIKVLKLPYTVCMLMCGMLVAGIYYKVDREVASFESLSSDLNPQAFAAIFHAALVFSGAFSTPIHLLERELWHYLWLAGPALVLGVGLTAAFVKAALPYDFSWTACLLLGSILSPTDPVAIINVLKDIGASERFTLLMEGESLFNDCTAFVLFEVFLTSLEQERSHSAGELIAFGLRLTAGGAALGLLLGAASAALLDRIFDDAESEITVVIVAVYGAYLLAESTVLEFSGVLAVVLIGIVLNHYGRPRITTATEVYLDRSVLY